MSQPSPSDKYQPSDPMGTWVPKRMSEGQKITTAVALVGGALLCSAAIAFGGSSASTAHSTDLNKAYTACAATSGQNQFLRLGDGGRSLAIDGVGKDSPHWTTALNAAQCIMDHTDMPSATRFKVDQTRALDGMVHDEWGDFEASWTYHPDNGLNMVIRED